MPTCLNKEMQMQRFGRLHFWFSSFNKLVDQNLESENA